MGDPSSSHSPAPVAPPACSLSQAACSSRAVAVRAGMPACVRSMPTAAAATSCLTTCTTVTPHPPACVSSATAWRCWRRRNGAHFTWKQQRCSSSWRAWLQPAVRLVQVSVLLGATASPHMSHIFSRRALLQVLRAPGADPSSGGPVRLAGQPVCSSSQQRQRGSNRAPQRPAACAGKQRRGRGGC